MDRGRSDATASPWSGSVVVGRDDLLARLTAAADAAARGTGSVVVLTGEAGIGKTTLARALARHARGTLDVVWGRCTADGAAPPFWPWRESLPADAVTTESGDATETAVGAERLLLLSRLRDALVERARRAPLLLVIEDLQWADVASVLLLGHLSASLPGEPLVVLATLRTGEPVDGPMASALEDVRRGAEVHPVPPLREADVAELVRAAGLPPDPELATLVWARTGGNPLFATEVLRAAAGHASTDLVRDALSGSVPSRVAELVAHRLGRLPRSVADVVVLASVLGTEGDVGTLARVREAPVGAVLELLEQARAARMLDTARPGRWEFPHALVRDSVYGAVPAHDLAALHGSALEALAADASTPPTVLAHHALAARPLFDADRAVALAARAGSWAFAQHAYEEAVTWFERALVAAPLGTAPRWRAELLVLSGEAHRHIGHVDEARHAFRDAAGLTGDPALLARAALGYADPGADLGIAYRTDDPVTGDLLDRAIAAQPPEDTVTTVLLEARLAAELYFSDEPGRARTLATAAQERARRLGDPRALVAAGAVIHDAFVVGQSPLDEQLARSEQLLVWARADGSAAARLTAHRARVFDLLSAGDLVRMDTEIVSFRRVAEPLKAPGYLWWLALWSAMRALLDGRHDVAEERMLAAFELGQRPFLPLAFINLSFQLFFLRREQGRFGEMEGPTRDYVASHADIPALRVGLAFLLAETGRTDEARGMLATFDDAELARLRDRNWPAAWFQLARVAFLVGDASTAHRLLSEANRPTEGCAGVSLATVCLGATDLAVAWLRHAVGDLDGADESYAAAIVTNARIGARSWLAQARADHAALLLDRDGPGDRDAARALVALAGDAAAAIPLPALVPIVDGLHRRLDAPAARPARAATRTTAQPRDAGAHGVFRRTGDVWEIEFQDRRAQLADARGLQDLAILLARPDRPVPALELLGAPDDRPAGRGALVLDDRARREIRARLQELEAEIDDAEADGDGARAGLAREQRQRLAESVARDLGLGGRSRRMDDPVERARKTVSTRIRRAIALVERSHPELGRHLVRSIDTGALCAYRPAEPVRWET